MIIISATQVLNLASDVLKHIPALIDYDAAAKLIADDMNPLNVVLLQEVSECILCEWDSVGWLLWSHLYVYVTRMLLFNALSCRHM